MNDATAEPETYAARLEIDYPEGDLNRVSSFFRIIWAIPILIIISVLTGGFAGVSTLGESNGEAAQTIGLGLTGSFALATALMIVFRQVYPRWWFDFMLELTRFLTRLGAYLGLLTDKYPSTVDEQSVHLELDYPNVEQDLNRWLPLVKWFLAIPHYIVLFVLGILAFFAVVIAWFTILFTGRYPRGLFDFVVGVTRWGLRVQAYAFLMLTDRYPPFSME